MREELSPLRAVFARWGAGRADFGGKVKSPDSYSRAHQASSRLLLRSVLAVAILACASIVSVAWLQVEFSNTRALDVNSDAWRRVHSLLADITTDLLSMNVLEDTATTAEVLAQSEDLEFEFSRAESTFSDDRRSSISQASILSEVEAEITAFRAAVVAALAGSRRESDEKRLELHRDALVRANLLKIRVDSLADRSAMLADQSGSQFGKLVLIATAPSSIVAVIVAALLAFGRRQMGALFESLDAARRSAEESARSKSQFLANMSHEIRTPMNGVVGMTDLLLRTDLTDRQRHYAQSVAGSAESLLTIINDILDFSKIEAGKLELDNTDLDVRRIVRDVLELLSVRANEKGLELTCQIDEGIESKLHGDPIRLRQILTNLVGNAVKFTEHGHVVVLVTRVPRDSEIQTLRFIVEDSGTGIAPEIQEMLFVPFAQADASTTRQFGGTGLGLAISSDLAQLMGGEIGVESTLGLGSSFWFTANFHPCEAIPANALDQPLDLDPAMLPRDELSKDEEGTGLLDAHILLAEDNVVNQELAVAMLEEFGCTVTVVSNGIEAVRVSAQSHHDLILMDCQMPQMDGFEATRLIRSRTDANSLARPTPIIALTANALDGDRERCLAVGMNDYLAKPFYQVELHSIIERWCDPTRD